MDCTLHHRPMTVMCVKHRLILIMCHHVFSWCLPGPAFIQALCVGMLQVPRVPQNGACNPQPMGVVQVIMGNRHTLDLPGPYMLNPPCNAMVVQDKPGTVRRGGYPNLYRGLSDTTAWWYKLMGVQCVRTSSHMFRTQPICESLQHDMQYRCPDHSHYEFGSPIACIKT